MSLFGRYPRILRFSERGGILFGKLKDKTDKRLIELCIKGDAPAWECLVRRYQKLIYHFPNDARLPREDCDEVLQETLLATFRSLEKLREVEALDQWLATVAKRTTWKIVLRRRKHPMESVSEGYDVEDPDDIPEKVVQLKVQQARVRASMKQLPEQCRKLLTMLFYKYDSADYTRIAEELGIARGSIGPIRHRCLARFKKILERHGINEKTVSEWLE